MSAPLPNYRRRRCASKLAYSDERVAQTAARDRTRKHGMRNVPYRCSVCRFWHLTVPHTGRSR